MSDLLAIGTSGVLAYRSAMSAVGENVANAETPGYSRRVVNLNEAGNANGVNVGYREQAQFGGVQIGSIGRAWDAFRAADSRYAAAAAGRAEARATWLSQVETAMGDGPGSVGVQVTAFFNSATQLAGNPGDRLGRSVTLIALQDAASGIRNTAEALARVSGGIQTAAQIDVDAINGALAALQNINQTMRQLPPGSTTHVSLQDERDRLIDSISARIGVEAHIAKDGSATLTLAGASAVTLIEPSGRGVVTLTAAADGRLSLALASKGTIAPLPASGGSLAGLVEAAAYTADTRAQLDTLAADFVSGINAWQAAGEDASGDPGAPLLSIGADARSIALVSDDPDRLAAAAPGGAANGNLLALDALRGPGSVEARWTNLVATGAQALSSAKSEAAAAKTWRDNSFAARDQISGVDLDFEAAELLRFQQAYGGSARIIQVARETLNTILDLF